MELNNVNAIYVHLFRRLKYEIYEFPELFILCISLIAGENFSAQVSVDHSYRVASVSSDP